MRLTMRRRRLRGSRTTTRSPGRRRARRTGLTSRRSSGASTGCMLWPSTRTLQLRTARMRNTAAIALVANAITGIGSLRTT